MSAPAQIAGRPLIVHRVIILNTEEKLWKQAATNLSD